MIHAIIQEDLLYDIARGMRLLPFEARKDAQILFSHILRFKPANAAPGDLPIGKCSGNMSEVKIEMEIPVTRRRLRGRVWTGFYDVIVHFTSEKQRP